MLKKSEWDELETRVERDFTDLRKLSPLDRQSVDIYRLTDIVVDTITYAAHLNSGIIGKNGWGPKHRFSDGTVVLEHGPAIPTLSLMTPAIFLEPEVAAYIYKRFISEASELTVPAEIFINVLNYANSLLLRFSQSHWFTDPSQNARREAKLRMRALQGDCLTLIERDENAEHPLRVVY